MIELIGGIDANLDGNALTPAPVSQPTVHGSAMHAASAAEGLGVLGLAPFAAMLLDRSLYVVAANASAQSLWALPPLVPMIGSRLEELLVSPPSAALEEVRAAIGGRWSGAIKLRRGDGGSLAATAHLYALPGDVNAPGMLVFTAEPVAAGGVDGVPAPAPVVPSASVNSALADDASAKQFDLDRSRLLVEHSPVEVWLLDEEGQIEYANSAAYKSVGHPRGFLEGKPIAEIDYFGRSCDPDRIRSPLIGHATSFETKHRHRDGGVISKEVVSSVFEIGDRRFVGSFAWDIAPQLRARAEVLSREAQLNTVLEAFPGIVASFDEKLRLLYVNDRLCHLLQRPRDVILRSSSEELVGYRRSAAIRDVISRLGASEDVHSEATVRWPDGTEMIMRTRYVSKSDPAAPGGRLFFAFGTDITELRRGQQRMASIISGTKTATWEWNFNTRELQVNDHFFSITGFTPEDAEDGLHFWLSLIQPRDKIRRKVALLRHLRGETEFFECEYRARSKSGELWLLERGTAFPGAGGDGHNVMYGTLQDISGLKRTEGELSRLLVELEDRVVQRTSQLAEATKEAERANRAKTEFLSFMSHELRTPLNAISGFGQLLAMSSLGETERLHVTEVLAATDLLVHLIDDLLDLSAIEAGRVSLTLESVQIGPLVSECLEIIRAAANRFDVRVQIDDIPASVVALADRRRLKQIVLNLATNAVKYNRHGGTLTLSASHLSASEVEVSVVDEGRGIPPEELGRIFEPFERLKTHGRDVEGTGIGLAVCKRLVALMHGTLGVTSEIDVGSTFHVRLPVPQDRSSIGEGASAEFSTDGEATSGRPAARFKVLYVEDDPASGRLVERALMLLPDVEIEVQSDPECAIASVRSRVPELLLLDLGLPGTSGGELLQRLRELGVSTRAVAVTALASPADVEATRAAGFAAHVKKPVNVADLLTRVRQFIGEASTCPAV